MSTRVRLVTCPTCREVLPEFPGIPLYKCGRCGTMLQAKNDNSGSASRTNPMNKHGHRNEQCPTAEEHTKGVNGDESMYLLRENREGPNEFPGGYSITVVESHRDEKPVMVEKEFKVLDEKNATHLGVSLSLEEGNVTNADLGTSKQSMLTESITKYDNYFKETQKEVHNWGPPSSEENLESLINSPRSSVGLMSKSPTEIYYASDARQINRAGNIIVSRPRIKDRLGLQKRQKDQLRIFHEPTTSSKTKVKRDIISTAGDWKQHYKLPEARNKMRKENNESDRRRMAHMSSSSQLPHGNRSPSSIKFNVKMSSSQLLHGNGSPSSIRLNVSQQHPEPHFPNSTFYDDPDKMELLNKVYELEEKLNQTQISEQIRNRRFNVQGFGEEKHTPYYDEDIARRRNASANTKHSGHHSNDPPEIARVAFSSEARRCRNQMDCACSHCCHQCLHHATKTCSHCILCQHTVYSRKNYDNEHPSSIPSPQTHSSNKFSSQFLERNSDNHLHKKEDVRKLPLRKKYEIVRRHLRPIAGGAPIMACHYCSELLQLPAEHTLSKRHICKLRCYACERVMKLSLDKKVPLVPYIPTISAPPPSEIDGYSDANHQ